MTAITRSMSLGVRSSFSATARSCSSLSGGTDTTTLGYPVQLLQVRTENLQVKPRLRSFVDMFTSNGLQFSVDTAARVRAIRLDAERPDPENRTFGFHLVTEASEAHP